MCDLSKKFIHMEDNEDGTMILTMNLVGGIENASAIQPGNIEDLITIMSQAIPPEALEEYNKQTVLIPDHVPFD